ncbi:MAG: methyltransferase domain-containing protein [Pseudomonadota bacterium]
MTEFLTPLLAALTATFLAVPLVFFIATRASLVVYSMAGQPGNRHIYWIYRSPLLIWLFDRQFISSLILLFQYHRLVRLVLGPACADKQGKRILQVSCVFGDFTRRLAACYHRIGQVFVFDIMASEVRHASRKLAAHRVREGCAFFQGDAAAMPFPAGTFDYVVNFFLFHELPGAMKDRVFAECLRVLKPGGVFVYGEFHKPESSLATLWGNLYFWIFEPYAREMWTWYPAAHLDPAIWRVERRTVLGGYFQVVRLERMGETLPMPAL